MNWGYTLLWPDATACLANYEELDDKYANWTFFNYIGENLRGYAQAGPAPKKIFGKIFGGKSG